MSLDNHKLLERSRVSDTQSSIPQLQPKSIKHSTSQREVTRFVSSEAFENGIMNFRGCLSNLLYLDPGSLRVTMVRGSYSSAEIWQDSFKVIVSE